MSDLNSGNDNKTGQHSPDKDLSVWKERLWGVVAGVIATVLCSSIVLIKNHLDEQKYKIGNTVTSSDGHEFEFTHLLTKECFWLLRTPGSSQEKVCRIYNSSYSDFYSGVGAFIDTDGVVVDGTLGIRPALWYKP